VHRVNQLATIFLTRYRNKVNFIENLPIRTRINCLVG